MKRVLITGATSGIGQALAAEYARRQIEVIGFGSQACDLLHTVTPIIDAIEEQQPDVVINNAGVGFYGDATTLSVERQKETLRINGEAAMEITIEAAKYFKAHKIEGTILNVSSIAGELPMPAMAAYGASKAFITSFSEAVDYELKPYGIRVLVSAPGMVKTDFSRRSGNKRPSSQRKIPVEKAAQLIIRQIERCTPFQVIDGRVRLLHLLLPFIPKSVLKKSIYDNITSRL